MSNETYLTILTIGLFLILSEVGLLIYLLGITLTKTMKLLNQYLETKETKNSEVNTRIHKAVAKVNYSTPMQNYEQYKDKQSGLYEPRRPSKGLKIEEREEAE